MRTHYCTAVQDNVPLPLTDAHHCRWCGLSRAEIIERHHAQQARWRREAKAGSTPATPHTPQQRARS